MYDVKGLPIGAAPGASWISNDDEACGIRYVRWDGPPYELRHVWVQTG